jgi:hypothetical protein
MAVAASVPDDGRAVLVKELHLSRRNVLCALGVLRYSAPCFCHHFLFREDPAV